MHPPIVPAQFVFILSLSICGIATAVEPRATSERYKLDLIASDPAIVTPIGVAFDRQGRLLVVESHTHLTAEGYKGLKHDRVRMLSDSDGDGKLDRWSTFAEGFRHAMNLLVREDGAVYLVTRHSVELLTDTDNDGVADKQETLLKLETKDDYPHNALSGIAREKDGSLIISYGENHGDAYTLTGADGTVIKDGGGQDGFYRMTADGKGIRRFARGVWNPFSVCVVPDGRIFAVDNDPDASPPCRLLHIVDGGDYGYLYQYGRAGTHPLQCWNGELPGTLPMMCGTGETPTAIVPHGGRLWVTSWGDHRIERYELVPRGVSYGAKREIIVQGDAEFRPTGMAVAPDGSLYFGDWVLRDYPVHGKGRIWRLRLPDDEVKTPFPPPSKEDLTTWGDEAYAIPRTGRDWNDPFGQAALVWYLANTEYGKSAPPNPTPGYRLAMLQAKRDVGRAGAASLLREALRDESRDVRLYAVRWIADDRIMELRKDLSNLLEQPQPNRQLYLALLGAVDWLGSEPSHRGANYTDEMLVRELNKESRLPEAHALALSLLSPDNKFLTIDRLRGYLQSENKALRLEAARSLAQQTNPGRFELLAEVARDEDQGSQVRAESIVGLSAAAGKYRDVLETLATSKIDEVQSEAKRALRLAGLRPAAQESKPPASDLSAWNDLLRKQGDAASGRRLFFSPAGPRCSLCHKYDGRGGNVGPELTNISRNNSRERIISSILQPSQEIAPDYQPWVLVTSDGRTLTGLRQPKPGDNGTEDYVDSAGTLFTLASKDIDQRHAATTSIMPDNLQTTLSIADLRDLVTFLSGAPD